MNNGLSKDTNKLIESYLKTFKGRDKGEADLSKDISPKNVWFILREIVHLRPDHVRTKENIFKAYPLNSDDPNSSFLYFVYIEGKADYYYEFDGLYWERNSIKYISFDGRLLENDDDNVDTYLVCENFSHTTGDKIL